MLPIFGDIRVDALLNEIEMLIGSQNPFDVLQSARMIKKLFIDEPPMIQQLIPDYQ